MRVKCTNCRWRGDYRSLTKCVHPYVFREDLLLCPNCKVIKTTIKSLEPDPEPENYPKPPTEEDYKDEAILKLKILIEMKDKIIDRLYRIIRKLSKIK